jgi:hypothetical protein
MAPEADAAGFLGLIEIEERESAVDAVALLAGVAAGVLRCACGAGTLGDEIAHRESGCTPMTGLHVVAEREAYPAPLVTSRDAWDGAGAPAVVVARAQSARDAGWAVRVQRSRGCAPHAVHGAAGALKWRYALRVSRPGRGGYAVHDGTTWKSVMLWGHDRTPFALASITDFAEYIDAGGDCDEWWYAAIRARLADGEQRKRERAACDKGAHALPSRETLGPLFGWWCARCNQTWPLHGEPWKKTKRGSGEAL